jgi:hypothetical protein
MKINYFDDCKNELLKLLEERRTSTTKDEFSVHSFFEKYPFAILSCLSIASQYSVFGNIVLSQPRLKSFDGDRQPDFLVATWDSLNIYFNFIEIEDPSKKIFSSTKLQPSAEFLQAVNQLKQWRSFKTEVVDYCEELLRTLYLDNFNSSPKKVIHYNYTLVYGFGDEITDLGERYNQLLQDYFSEADLFHCTYSRLLRNAREERPMFSVKRDSASNKFKAIGVTPFKKYRAEQWSDFHNVIGKEKIINESLFFDAVDKISLIEQMEKMDKKSYKEVVEIMMAEPGLDFLDPESHIV